MESGEIVGIEIYRAYKTQMEQPYGDILIPSCDEFTGTKWQKFLKNTYRRYIIKCILWLQELSKYSVELQNFHIGDRDDRIFGLLKKNIWQKSGWTITVVVSIGLLLN